MERVLEVRRPPEQSQTGLSRASKIFFGCDIFQVIAVIVFQSSMIALGDFSAYNNTEHPGMGPGRRIYMAIYMGAVFYTCLLCLFAVKQQNFMEIIAFDLQNFGFLAYSFVQLYHVRFKKYNGLRTSESDALPKIVIANAMTLLILNIVFTYLSYKLYMEFGWKIYKRVRFNIRLRGIYQLYELLSCLLKMEILYWGMFAIVHSLVLLRDSHNILYFMSLSFIPLTLMYAGLGYYAARRENRVLMLFFLTWTLAGIGYFLYKLYGFVTRTCNGCAEFEVTGKDIPSEAFMHFVYLGIMNLVVVIIILGVAVKVYRNFGGGLAQHFRQKKKPEEKSAARLNLGRGSHCYTEESVISVTSYDSAYDEFGESVSLDRGMLHPVHTELPLLTDNGHLRVDKRSCSLPNLLSGSSAKAASCTGRSDGDGSLLSGWMQAEEEKRDSANLEIISEEVTPEHLETFDSEAKLAPDEMFLQADETTQGSGVNASTDSVHTSPKNGDVTFPNFHVQGCVNNTTETLARRDVDLLPKHTQNGHHSGKARLKHTGAGFENGCRLRAVNSCDENDEQTSSQGSPRDFSTRKPLDLSQRTTHFAQGIV